MQKYIYKLCNFPIWTVLVLVGLFITLPQLNNQDYIMSTVTTKLIFFLYVILLLGALYTIHFVQSKKITFCFTKLDIALLLLLIYITVNRYFIQSHFGFSIRFLELLGLGFLYVVLRSVGKNNYPWLLIAIIVSGIFQAVYGILQLLGYCASNHSGFKMTGSFFNPGPYAGFLVSVWTVAVGMYLFKDYFIKQVQSYTNNNSVFFNQLLKNAFEYIPLTAVIAILIVLPATESRAAWISSITGTLILLELKYVYAGKIFHKITSKILKIFLIPLIVVIVFVAFLGTYYYKKESTEGRTFIWKITTEIIANDPVFGVGFDRFKAHYMNYQANYFALNGKTREALTADNTYYAFNEALQFVSENGFIGLLLLIIVIVFLIQTKSIENKQTELIIAKTALLTIGVFACFSYSMQILPIKLVLVVLLALVSNVTKTFFQFKSIENNSSLWIFKSSYVLVALMFMYPSFCYTQNLKQGFNIWQKALNYYTYVDYNEAIKAFETVYPIFRAEGDFLMNYGKTLAIAGKPQKAILILEQAKVHQNNTIITTALGDCHKATKQYNKAVTNYVQAINMTPIKFFAPYLLAKLYDVSGQKEKAVKLAHEILNKKIKVHSTAIDEIQIEMKGILKKYKNPLGSKN